jgi:alkanesulfonate monooxygenase SsuD/methylene tetrahydromethanopterin reductase-like flavin-dependent oxidoreductase (luciferase family)
LASYKGEFIEFKDAEVYPKPVQKPHPPVWVGGWMKLAAKRAGKYGEGWIPGWLSPKEMKVGCDILAQTAQENGRDPKKITIAVEKLATIAKTRDEGLQLALPTLKTSSESYERDIDNMQFALDRHIFGSVDDVRRRVDEFIENGVQHFELKIIYPSMDSLERQMTLWAESVLPHYE